MTTRRTFLGSALFAASAATLPRLALAPDSGPHRQNKDQGRH